MWVETKLDQTSFLIGSFYRPPSSNVEYWKLVEESIRKVNNTLSKFLILGDFNTDFLNAPSQHLLQIMNRYQLTQLINEPTRITETSKTCLDLVITQSPNIVMSTEILPAICSDHSVPCAIVKNSVVKSKAFRRTIFNYRKLDAEKFRNLLSEVDWDDIIYNKTVDESAEIFSEILIEKAKMCMPTKTVTVHPNDVPWMTDEIRLLIEERKEIHRLAKRSDKPEDWLQFRHFRNYVTSREKQRIAEYYMELENKVSDSTQFGHKEWWKLVKLFLKKKGVDSNKIPPILSDGVVFHTSQGKANVFNDFFITQSTLENEDDVLPAMPFCNYELREITLSSTDVKEVIANLNKNKAVGPDQVHNNLLISALPIILNPLTVIFNRSLNETKFPQIWKTAHVTPLYKKSSKELCSNYRPISLLSCVGKVMERCIHKQVYFFLSSNGIISPAQSGFTPGDSTINQLICIYNSLCFSFDRGITTQAVFYDISKAFDRVWHKGLLYKIRANGIRGKLLDWFKDYLSNRTQAVVIENEKSNYKRIPAGVPQGSVLGPLLFLIYINDIVEGIESNIKLFADDTSMSLALNNPDIRAEILNSDLEKINSWAKRWKVKFNEQKTELLNFIRDNKPVLPLTFNNIQLQSSDKHKHLGLILQSNCKWDEQIKSIMNTVTMLLACLKSYKYKLNRKSLETMYKSFILPHFDYADVIWDNCTEEQANSLENLHLEALRIIVGAIRGTSHQKLYEESGFCSLKERRKRHKIVYYYKMVHGICPDYLSDLVPDLVSENNPYHRRRPLERKIQRCNTETYRKSFLPSATTLWNCLPDNIKTSNSLSALKRYLSTGDHIVPPYHYLGERKEQIVHCRLRLGMSDLNDDLFNRHLVDNSQCVCGYERETADHYLLSCPRFNAVRENTILQLPQNYIQAHFLLKGSQDLQMATNTLIFQAVHKFISQSRRF